MTAEHEELLRRLDTHALDGLVVCVDAATAIRAQQQQLTELLKITGDDSIEDAKLSWQTWTNLLNDASDAITTGEAWDKNHYPSPVDRAFYVALKQQVAELTAQVEAERKAREDIMHASRPTGYKCSDCTIDKEPCPRCYIMAWRENV